jgi:alpha-beta hydrolase superfamily lysophospholipase
MRPALAAALLALSFAAGANERRTIEVPVATATVAVDVHLSSPGASPQGGVVLVHGLMRTRETMAGHAGQLASRGLVAVALDAPSIADATSNAAAIREVVAMLRAGRFSAPVDRVVLVGFSIGGLWSLLAADAPGVIGWIGLDPVDVPDRRGLEVARALNVPAFVLRAPATPCNAYGNTGSWTKAFAQPAGQTLVPDATHCDFESPTDGWCRFFCGESDERRQRAVSEALLAEVMKRFPPAPR